MHNSWLDISLKSENILYNSVVFRTLGDIWEYKLEEENGWKLKINDICQGSEITKVVLVKKLDWFFISFT